MNFLHRKMPQEFDSTKRTNKLLRASPSGPVGHYCQAAYEYSLRVVVVVVGGGLCCTRCALWMDALLLPFNTFSCLSPPSVGWQSHSSRLCAALGSEFLRLFVPPSRQSLGSLAEEYRWLRSTAWGLSPGARLIKSPLSPDNLNSIAGQAVESQPHCGPPADHRAQQSGCRRRERTLG